MSRNFDIRTIGDRKSRHSGDRKYQDFIMKLSGVLFVERYGQLETGGMRKVAV